MMLLFVSFKLDLVFFICSGSFIRFALVLCLIFVLQIVVFFVFCFCFCFLLFPQHSPVRGNRRESKDGDWEKPFNPWVVLESETLREARKTDQLEFLELEEIKVGRCIASRPKRKNTATEISVCLLKHCKLSWQYLW